jgi:hypothetical protein
VVVQDTGFRPYYPIGEGLFDFTNLDEATAAIESIESNYRRHCEAARSIAESHFAAGTVLTRLLQQVGL